MILVKIASFLAKIPNPFSQNSIKMNEVKSLFCRSSNEFASASRERERGRKMAF